MNELESTNTAKPVSKLQSNEVGYILPPHLIHDLRTPLNQIIGYSEMLVEQAHDEGQAGFVPDLNKIHLASHQLLSLISSSFHSMNNSAAHSEDASDDPATDAPPATWGAIPVVYAYNPAAGSGGTKEGTLTVAPLGSILVVDDNGMKRDVLSRRLRRQGYAVESADNGCVAMEMVRAQAFDLVLLDILMPEMDGYAVLQELKADEELRHIPVIMISELDELDSVVRCIELGAEDYLPSPFNPTLLKARIGACMEKKHARDRELQHFKQLQLNYKRLQELEKIRDDLTHMIIHDLRTPMSSVMMGMQMVEGAGTLNDLQREIIVIALNGGQTVLGMISDLLDVDKMEAGAMQLNYEAVQAVDLFDVAIHQVTSLIQGKKLRLVRQIVPGLPTFQGDTHILIRILVNLLGNAIKFTPSGGTITVVARESDDTQSIEFSVRDTGEGVPESAIERIFEKFCQVNSRLGGRQTSTGLGLTFCKLATEAHNGQIGIQSVLGEGSNFWIKIPLQPNALG